MSDGVLEATKEVGGNVEEVAKVLVTGAIDSAAAASKTTVQTAKEVMIGAVEGVKEVVGSVLPETGEAEPVVVKESAEVTPTTAAALTETGKGIGKGAPAGAGGEGKKKNTGGPRRKEAVAKPKG
jgi:hypothetical protein